MDTMEKEKKKKSLKAKRQTATVFCLAFAVLAVLLLLGVVIVVVLLEAGDPSRRLTQIYYILACGFAGGAISLALGAFGLGLLSEAYGEAEIDFRERCDSEESFFVGDDTLITFLDGGARIHGEIPGGVLIDVPYADMRFFSVCTRRTPREKGRWLVLIEIPAHYLSKEKNPSSAPLLVQTDGKERLYECLRKHGLTLDGEERAAGKAKKFTKLKKFPLPVTPKRKKAFIPMAAGGVLIAGGIVAAFFIPIFGAVAATLGALVLGRGVYAFFAAARALAFYEEGLYWKEETFADSLFLKWGEIERLVPERQGEESGLPAGSFLRVECAYGDYHIYAPSVALAYLKENYPDKLAE